MKKFLTSAFTAICVMFVTLPVQAGEVLVVVWKDKAGDWEQVFMDHLKKIQPDVKFRIVTAERSKSTLATKLRHTDFSKIDLVYSEGTTGSKIVDTFLKNTKPIVFNYVTDPVGSKLIESNEKPGKNITGVQFLIPIANQLEIMAKLKNIKKMAVWFDPREKHTKVALSTIQKKLTELNIEPVLMRVIPDAANSDKVLNKAIKEAKQVDAVYLISSYSYFAQRKKILSRFDPSVLTVSSVSHYTYAGATLTIASEISERAETLAGIAKEILNGKNARDIPVSQVTLDKTVLYVNKKKAASSGIKDLEKLGLKIKYVEPTS